MLPCRQIISAIDAAYAYDATPLCYYAVTLRHAAAAVCCYTMPPMLFRLVFS